MEEANQIDLSDEDIVEKKDYSSFDNYTKKQVTLQSTLFVKLLMKYLIAVWKSA